MRRVRQRGGQPRERHRDAHGGAQRELRGAPAARARQSQPGDQRQPRQRDERLQQLDVEGQSERGRGREQPGGASGLGGAHHQQQGEHRERHHDRVHRVAARGDHGDREHRQRESRGERGAHAEDAPHGLEQQRDGERAGERLGELQRGGVEAEQLARWRPAATGPGAACRSRRPPRARPPRRRSCARRAPCCARRRRRTGRRRPARDGPAATPPRPA